MVFKDTIVLLLPTGDFYFFLVDGIIDEFCYFRWKIISFLMIHCKRYYKYRIILMVYVRNNCVAQNRRSMNA